MSDDVRIVGFDELDDLWLKAEIEARWQDDLGGLFASWEVNLDDLFPTPNLGDLDFGYIGLSGMLQ